MMAYKLSITYIFKLSKAWCSTVTSTLSVRSVDFQLHAAKHKRLKQISLHDTSASRFLKLVQRLRIFWGVYKAYLCNVEQHEMSAHSGVLRLICTPASRGKYWKVKEFNFVPFILSQVLTRKWAPWVYFLFLFIDWLIDFFFLSGR